MIKRTLISLFTAGWLIPLWLGVNSWLDFWQFEVWPRLVGGQPMNSFPMLDFSRQCLATAVIWLGLVLLFWSWLGSARVSQQKRDPDEASTQR